MHPANYAIATLMTAVSKIVLPFSLSLEVVDAWRRIDHNGYCFIAYSILWCDCVGTSRTQLCIWNALTRPRRRFCSVGATGCSSVSV